MPERLLNLNGLNAHYGDFQALFDVNMKLAAGEVLAIIGSNGAGKTALMRSISGLLRNRADQVVYRNQPIGALRADQIAVRGIALVPEGRQLFPVAVGRRKSADRRAGGSPGAVVAAHGLRSVFPFWRNGASSPQHRFRAGNNRWSPLAVR